MVWVAIRDAIRNVIALRRGAIFMVLALGVFVWGFSFLRVVPPVSIPSSYWIWAGIRDVDVPVGRDYYIYQGQFAHQHGNGSYERLGLHPYPIQARSVVLVYRMVGDFPSPQDVLYVFQGQVARWQRHGVSVVGMQIDFDSATSKLLLYGDFLHGLRQALPSEYRLSITGLGDWILYGDAASIKKIGSSVDEIVFQLYQERKAIDSADRYVRELEDFPFPFKVGLLSGVQDQASVRALLENRNFKGIVYFVQR